MITAGKFLKLFSIALGLFVAASFLLGSALWTALGLAQDLTINGKAPVVADIDDQSYLAWSAYGGDKKGTRFSAFDQITPDNVNHLTIVWNYKSGAFNDREQVRDNASFETTPILVENLLVFCTQFNEVIALEPDTGRERWRFDPEVPLDGRPANRFTCRGVSHWQDSKLRTEAACASRVFVGTVDARIIALDTKTGQRCDEFSADGEVTIEPNIALRWPGEMQITSAPAIVGDVVITGTAISDNLRTQAPLGTVFAFDARTGEPQWSFKPFENDQPSIPSEARATAGHANVWSTMAVDEQRGLVFLPTSSPSPDYYGGNRIGNNSYANSVVALDGKTGSVRWHFQAVHHDVWDYDLPAQPGLYTVSKGGKKHDVVSIATKMGLVFVLDRETGKPFLPIDERPVPQAAVEGESLSPTQPFPRLTPPLVPNTLDPDRAFGITVWDKLSCRKQIASLRAEGLFTPPSLQGSLALPFAGGGANWGSTAFDPSRNLLLVNMSNVAQYVRLTRKTSDERSVYAIKDDAEYAPMEGAPYSMSRALLVSPLGLPCSPPPWGVLVGVDLASGEIVWRKTLGTTEDLAPASLAFDFGTPNFGGPIVTASGLVFIGAAMDDYLRAFSAETGEELWKGRLPAGGQATPMTYEFKGRQYVVIAAGGHSSAGTNIGESIVAFALSNR